MAVLQTRTWSGTTYITLLQHTSMQRMAYIQLPEAAEQVPAEVPVSTRSTSTSQLFVGFIENSSAEGTGWNGCY